MSKAKEQPLYQSRFIECDTCRIKTGASILCGGCVSNRALIADLQVKAYEKEPLTKGCYGRDCYNNIPFDSGQFCAECEIKYGVGSHDPIATRFARAGQAAKSAGATPSDGSYGLIFQLALQAIDNEGSVSARSSLSYSWHPMECHCPTCEPFLDSVMPTTAAPPKLSAWAMELIRNKEGMDR